MAPTARVETPKDATAAPAGTSTLAATLSGSAPESVTAAPPVGAAAVNVTVPVTGFPPTTLPWLSETDASATDGATGGVGASVVGVLVLLHRPAPRTTASAVASTTRRSTCLLMFKQALSLG